MDIPLPLDKLDVSSTSESKYVYANLSNFFAKFSCIYFISTSLVSDLGSC